jgi:hypothetical protein
MRRILAGLLMLSALPFSMAVSAANPQLLAREQGIEDENYRSQALRIADLKVEVDQAGGLADFTITARFMNPSDDDLEGEFSFELPHGAVVTGYALDIEGHLVDGVLVDPLKAERAYEAQVRRGIDPGVAKVSRANVFNTRIYPIPEHGERIIRLHFAAPVHPLRGLSFPLATAEAVGNFNFEMRSVGATGPVKVTLPNSLPLDRNGGDEGAGMRASLEDRALQGELRIGTVQPRSPALVTRHRNGERLAHIVDTAPRGDVGARTGRRLRVYWDRSLSRREQSLEAERALLGEYVAGSRPASIDLVTFNSSGASLRRLGASELDAALAKITYRGGTSFAVLSRLDAPAADVCLVFTDGVATIDARPDFDPHCEVFAITSAGDADRGFLQRLTDSPSAVMQLGIQSPDEILARLRGEGPRVVHARAGDGSPLAFVALDGGERGWSVIVEAPADGEIVLGVAGLRSEILERRYVASRARMASFDAAGALWAATRAARLAAEDDGHERYVALSRKFSVASPGLSFLVLEQPFDYVLAGIEPPANYPEEGMQLYRESLAEREQDRRQAREERIESVLEQWQELNEWWKTRFDPQAKAGGSEELRNVLATGQANAPALRRQAMPAVEAAAGEELDEVNIGVESVVVTGLRASRRDPMVQKSISIEVEEWSLDRPYLEALEAARPANFEAVFAKQQEKYGALPAFYFDVAEWLHRKRRTAEAMEMLLSALELPVANEETASMVADRLQRFGAMDRAIWLLERAAAQTDYLPQPRRALALALSKRAGKSTGSAARADLQRAVKLLDEVIMLPWEGGFDGIEMVALMEVNEMLPRLRSAGVHDVPLDRRLRGLLDVDLRVVIEWNTMATDMDLWVDEPNGERAIYSHPRTAIGGRLSNDMTQGYGPEEYLLRRAPSGEYRISVNVYAADVINPNGTTVVTARLIRNFGRSGQREETMEIELEPGDEGEKLIGTFKVQ